MTDYTRTEAETIRKAWARLTYYAETHSATAKPQELEQALRDEKAQVSTLADARALLLETLADTCDPDSRTGRDPADVWSYRRAHRDMIAFALMHREALIEAGITHAARQAANMNRQATRRALDAIDAQ